MEVVIANYGSFLGKSSERLVVKEGKKVVAEVPFPDIEQVNILTNGASLSTDVIRECTERGIQINFLSSSGRPYAKLTSPNLTATVITRREQIFAYRDERGVTLAKAFIEGKIKNQVNVLKYFAKYRKTADPALFGQILDMIKAVEEHLAELSKITGPAIDEVRGQLLSVEGRAANLYWQAIKALTAGKVEFGGREHRGAADPVNSALNYGYGILYSRVWGALLLAGLEPFAGFLHVDRPGKPSLVLDLVEEFRQQVVDRSILAMVGKGAEIEVDDGKLTDASRRELARRILERLEAPERLEGKKVPLTAIIQRQCRRVANFVRGEGRYKPFVGGW
ncbi:MAG: CRISPR-associated endonuclease Cas1 [Firmicutes bacterium]|nr:CRISPR-associated endonuclease Cas1 [Bacillota bacterium]